MPRVNFSFFGARCTNPSPSLSKILQHLCLSQRKCVTVDFVLLSSCTSHLFVSSVICWRQSTFVQVGCGLREMQLASHEWPALHSNYTAGVIKDDLPRELELPHVPKDVRKGPSWEVSPRGGCHVPKKPPFLVLKSSRNRLSSDPSEERSPKNLRELHT